MAIFYFVIFTACLAVNNGATNNCTSGTIEKENIKFYHMKLTNVSSTSITIEFWVNYTLTNIYDPYVVIDIYTTEDHINVLRQCSFLHYGQLFNDELHIPLNMRSYKETACAQTTKTRICNGRKTIRDFKPRIYYISFGYDCDNVRLLPGISYKFSVFDQSNQTKCSGFSHNVYCSNFYRQILIPNLLGHSDVNRAQTELDRAQTYLNLFNSIRDGLCYKHLDKIKCFVFLPKCDLHTKQMIPPCKEACLDFMDACFNDVLYVLKKSTSSQMGVFNLNTKLQNSSLSGDQFLDCNYLSSVAESFPCFFEPVTCNHPPNATNADLQNVTELNDTYLVHSKVVYLCQPGTYMIGANSVQCQYDGNWTQPPICEKITRHSNNLIRTLFPILIVLFFLLVTLFGVIAYKRKRKNSPKLFRHKDYDAFVCYSYETTDANFAEKTIRVELEENIEPALKLCIHRRDFLAAWDTMWNINNAIQNSNSAIIVMSQDYVSSLWCKEEFEQCYMEHMKDPAFKLFVILMQPSETLENTSLYMDSFFAHKTYLDVNDSKLFKKISDYLKWIKIPRGKDGLPDRSTKGTNIIEANL